MSEPYDERPSVPSTDENGKADVRLELKPDFPRTGFVDGAWWPRSRDLRAEVPALVAAINERLGRKVGQILRVEFGRKEWNPTDKQRLVTPTGRVAFGGWQEFEPDLVWLVSRSTSLMPIALVVIPPETSHDRATSTLHRASDADNKERSADLLEREDEQVRQRPGS